MRALAQLATLCLAALLLVACAAPARLNTTEQTQLSALLPADALLLGEQHDAPEHHRLERATVQWLAERGQLAALVLEMAEQGHDTRALPPGASAAAVRSALAWDDAAWPWSAYGPVVMATVRAGVPVWGANLPRANLREAMRDEALDGRLPPAAWAEQQQRIREGHCNSLPESQIVPMTRVQVARDVAMARAVAQAVQPGRTVLLVAGNGHVQRALGVPMHLPAGLKVKVISALTRPAPSAADADLAWSTAAPPPRDHCAEFKRPGAAQ